MVINLKTIPKLRDVFYSTQRYVVTYGGRGGGKSVAIAQCIIMRMLLSKTSMRVLCCREIQKSIKESVYVLLVDAIHELGVQEHFEILSASIRVKKGGDIFFSGIKNNVYEIKSMANIDICWVEEAGNVSQTSWDILLPTIRKEGSQMLISFNPTEESSPTHKLFLNGTIPVEDILLINVNYWDNPYISETLIKEMERMKKEDYDRYLHHWEGKPLSISNAAIFKGKFHVQPVEFTLFDGREYFQGKKIEWKYGMDFGFSTDPFAFIECFRHGEFIYITREIYWHQMENLDIVPIIKTKMPEVIKNHRKIYADSAYPATISQLSKPQLHTSGEKLEALYILGAVKGPGSVEEGINWLKSYTLIVDPSCKNTIFELNNYVYMTDKDTGEIIPKIKDANNHLCVSGDTWILSCAGNMQIKDMVGNDIYKTICYDENTESLTLANAYHIQQTSKAEQLYEIELVDGKTIKATANHPFLTQRGWIELQNLTINDELMCI